MTRTDARTRALGPTALLTAACLLLTVPPAYAANPAGTASLGSVDIATEDRAPVVIRSLARCDANGPRARTAAAGAVSAPGIRFGGGNSKCTTSVDPVSGETTTKSEAVGKSFELSGLRSVGGPAIRIRDFRVTCIATSHGTLADWTINGLSGISGLPDYIPANYVHPIRRKSDGTLLAEAVFNETTRPKADDGRIDLNALHLKFLPESRITGEVIVGRVACSPTD
ncbi:hypothetical protein ABIE67_009984 [Streptomyces sp. V4I8]|uniref:choice-of-anchor P family protein n=1 Tax=Streptomyces sp. V4I8 TaxID=3156469 RepID=UPI0035193CC4